MSNTMPLYSLLWIAEFSQWTSMTELLMNGNLLGSTTSTQLNVVLTVVDVNTSGFESGSSSSFSSSSNDASYASAAAQLSLLAKSNIPASITLLGQAYIQILEYTSYFDAGVTAYDPVDGFLPVTSTTYQLCSISPAMQAYLQSSWDSYNSSSTYTSNVDTSIVLDLTQLTCRLPTPGGVRSDRAGSLSEVSLRHGKHFFAHDV